MKKALILVGILSGAIVSHAGYKALYPLQISQHADGSGEARGSLGDVRASSSAVEQFGCFTSVYADSIRTGYCEMESEKTGFGGCWTTDPSMLATIDTLNGDSSLVYFWSKDGECAMVAVNNFSSMRPKTP
jgi:hypothetical protein